MKKGELLNETLISVVLIGIVFIGFLGSVGARINSRGVHQQVLEKQLALLVDSAEVGMSFSVDKKYGDVLVDSLDFSQGRVFVRVNGFSSKGYPYFSRHSFKIIEEEDKFVVRVL